MTARLDEAAFQSRWRVDRRQSGLTLVEVMVGMLLVGILLVGTNTLWVVVANQFDALSLRQQAILRLDGEMARLVEVYGDSAVTVETTTVTDYAIAAPNASASYISTPASRLIHNTGGGAQDYVVAFAGAANFRATVLANGSNAGQVMSPIYYFDAGVGVVTSDDRNLIWLDRDRNIVGQLSWSLTPIIGTDLAARDCGAASCNVLTLYLDYPFRFDVTVDPLATAQSEISGAPVETITLQTIVGHRL
jgi:prepilin-type N-terminal cleavage/methylation domain-containing protein